MSPASCFRAGQEAGQTEWDPAPARPNTRSQLVEGVVRYKHRAQAVLLFFLRTVRTMLPEMVSDAIVVSVALGWPTMGSLTYMANVSHDVRLIGFVFLCWTTALALGAFLLELLEGWADLRVALAE